MDEALDLGYYLPDSFKTSSEEGYVSFLWKAFEENYRDGNYQFAFLAYHMLMMSFAYFKIWQVRESRPADFEKALIGFTRDAERALKDDSPFDFSRVNERGVLRLFRLIGCDDGQIGNYMKLVGDRNDTAHANGNIYFGTRHEIDVKIRQVLRAVREIQSHFQPVVGDCYRAFLLRSRNPDAREFTDIEDEIREGLIRSNYLSRQDISLCANFDIAALLEESNPDIEDLHNTLREVYGTIPE